MVKGKKKSGKTSIKQVTDAAALTRDCKTMQLFHMLLFRVHFNLYCGTPRKKKNGPKFKMKKITKRRHVIILHYNAF